MSSLFIDDDDDGTYFGNLNKGKRQITYTACLLKFLIYFSIRVQPNSLFAYKSMK